MKKKRHSSGVHFLLAVTLAWFLMLNCAMEERLELQTEENPEEKIRYSAEPEIKVPQFADTETEAEQPGDQKMTAEQITPAEEELSEESAPMIRVLLTDSDYSSYFHPSAALVYAGEEIILTRENFDQKLAALAEGSEDSSPTAKKDAREENTASPENEAFAENGSIVFPPSDGGIQINSIQRQCGSPVYEGSLIISSTGDGLLLINELSLEDYLKGVVPSEMPSSYQPEALKAQAICARTYARKQMQEQSLKDYGADVDDSVSFQVYGNIAPQKSTSAAVEATEGRILCQNGEPIEAYYFSTSAGVTSTDEIWGADSSSDYLKSVSCTFDSEEPWSRWQVEIPWTELQTRASSIQGKEGTLLDIAVTRKLESGAVTGLNIVTDAGSGTLDGEYAIRQFLSPSGLEITENDGTITTGGTLLPSPYFELTLHAGTSVTVTGGGYGHGVGMSQTAAQCMAEEGYTCEEILFYFFQDVELVQYTG